MTGLTGKTLGRYRVLERIGRGGMAEVYKAYQPALDRHVAIKVLHSFLLEEADSRDRFSREARAVATLRHPHIVQVFDFDNEGDEYFMVMEYIDGPNLKARLNDLGRTSSRLSLDEIGAIISAIGGALGYAHRQGMIHRDVKPHNIMFTSDGQALLTDFGIAKIVSGSNVSASGTLSGTPAYMSPEQGRAAVLDPRTDLYSLGVVLYEMLTGRVPFDADTPFAVVIKHINEPLPLPRTLDPTIAPVMERLVFKALAKDPADRFQTADAFVQATQAAIAEAAVLDPRHSAVSYPPVATGPQAILPPADLTPQPPPLRREGEYDVRTDLTPQLPPLQRAGELDVRTDLTPLPPPLQREGESSALNVGSPLPSGEGSGVRSATDTTDPRNPPSAIRHPPSAARGVQAKVGMGRLSCSIVVGLVGALVLLVGTVGFIGGRSSSPSAGAIMPTVVAAAQIGGVTTQAAPTPVVTATPLLAAALPSSDLSPTAEPPAGAAQALAAQQYTAALVAYEAVLATNPHNSVALLGKAQALLGLARYQEAADTAAQAISNSPAGASPAAQTIHAHANMMMGNGDAANAEYSALIAAHPTDPDPLRDRAEALLARDQPSAALADLRKAVALAPNDGRTLVALGRAYAATADGVTPQPAQALAAFNRAIALNPQMAVAYAERGRFYAFVQDDRPQGLLDVTQAIKIGPPTAAWYHLRAEIEGGQGHSDEQLRDLNQALTLDPTDPTLYHARAAVYLDQGQVDAAATQLDRALELAPGDIGYLTTRSLVRLLRNDPAGATSDAQAVITADEGEPDGYAALARVQLHSHAYPAALTQARAAIQRSRPDTKAGDLALRGRIYVRLEQAAQAQADIEAALVIAGDNSDALLGQAELAVLRGQPATAVVALDRWESGNTRDGAGFVLRATIAVAAEDPVQARIALDTARKRLLFPDEQEQAATLARQLRP